MRSQTVAVSDLLDRVTSFGRDDNAVEDLDGGIFDLDDAFGADEAAPVAEDGATLDDLLDPDPAPPKKRGGSAQPPSKSAPVRGKATLKQKAEIKDAISMMLLMGGGTISFRDQHCGGAILEHAENIADKLTPIICRNPTMLAWFTGSSGYMDYFALAMALLPVGKTIVGHHVTKTLGSEEGADADYSQFAAPAL
jgi:hypothetical protein